MIFSPSDLGDPNNGKFVNPKGPTRTGIGEGDSFTPFDDRRDERSPAVDRSSVPTLGVRSIGLGWAPFLDSMPELSVEASGAPERANSLAVDPLPLTSPGASVPSSQPAARTTPQRSLNPQAQPKTRPNLDPFLGDPLSNIAPRKPLQFKPSERPRQSVGTLELPQAQPVPKEDPACKCKPKKKDNKKRKEREVCYSGTFTETKKSTRKVRRRKVPCQ